jgi:hypothetical protein
MACSLSSLPRASFCHWRGGSAAGPSHKRASPTICSPLSRSVFPERTTSSPRPAKQPLPLRPRLSTPPGWLRPAPEWPFVNKHRSETPGYVRANPLIWFVNLADNRGPDRRPSGPHPQRISSCYIKALRSSELGSRFGAYSQPSRDLKPASPW